MKILSNKYASKKKETLTNLPTIPTKKNNGVEASANILKSLEKASHATSIGNAALEARQWLYPSCSSSVSLCTMLYVGCNIWGIALLSDCNYKKVNPE